MKDLQSGAQSAIEYGVVVLLLVIIFAGSYKLYKNWTTPEPARIHQANLMEKPSRELCTYVMNQCKARYDMH